MNISTPPANPPWGWRCPGLGNMPPPPGDKKKFSGDVRSMNDSSSLTNTSSVSLIQSEHSTCGWQETCGQNRGGGLFVCRRPHTFNNRSLCPHRSRGQASQTTVPAGGVSPDAAPGPADGHHLHVFTSPIMTLFNLITSSKTLLPILSHSEVQGLKVQCMEGAEVCKELSSISNNW